MIKIIPIAFAIASIIFAYITCFSHSPESKDYFAATMTSIIFCLSSGIAIGIYEDMKK